MGKTKRIGFLFLGGSVILTSLGLFAYKQKTARLTECAPIIFSEVRGKTWVEKCIEKHPEVLWLADVQVRKTEENQATLDGSYSEQLFGKKFIEFDRTIMTLHCLQLILDGSDQAYHEFADGQASDVRLSKESFDTLHRQGQNLLNSKWHGMSKQEMALAMETALVLGDMGKSEKAREVFKSYGIHSPDHDDFYGEAMHILEKDPKLCPSFVKLNPAGQSLLVSVSNLAHYGHITHLEGGLNMFTKLKQSEVPVTDPIALSFDLFVHTCDVAGALGHVNNRSSLVFTEPAHRAMLAMGDAVRLLSDPNNSEKDAYNAYLTLRASWLGLDANDKMDRVLARIGAMLRLSTAEEGRILKEAVSKLEKSEYERIISRLEVSENVQEGRTPTYMPAVLVNLLNNSQLGSTKEERLTQAIQIGLPFIAKVLETHNEHLSAQCADPTIPLNFNPIAGIAKTAPKDLLTKEFAIDKDGNVILP